MWIAFVFEAVAIVTGNVTVLVVFTRTPSLRKRKHYLLVNLALADLLVGLVSVPIYIVFPSMGRTVPKEVFRIQDIFFGTASVFGLTAVAIERVYAVYFPFKHRTLEKGAYITVITVVWFSAAVFSCIGFLTGRDKSVLIVRSIIPISLSLVTVTTSYFLIWIKMNCMTNVQGHAIHGSDKKLTVTLLMVTIISFIAWVPFQVLSVLPIICFPCIRHTNQYVLVGGKFLQYSNSLVNPIIYAFRMPQFKKALLNWLRCASHPQVPQVHPRNPNYDGSRGRNDAMISLEQIK